MNPTEAPPRTVHVGDGLAWLRTQTLEPTEAIVTSLPDVSEVGMSLAQWRTWFVDAATLVCQRVHPLSVAIFFQTDIKVDGAWIDKAYLVQRGAEAASSVLRFHKIVCRAPVGTVTFGRPAFAHLLCFSHGLAVPASAASADVLPSLGHMPWARAMGTSACVAAATFLRKHTSCTTVIDPFCGHGTMLAVAGAHGFAAVGVELSAKRAKKALALQLNASAFSR